MYNKDSILYRPLKKVLKNMDELKVLIDLVNFGMGFVPTSPLKIG